MSFTQERKDEFKKTLMPMLNIYAISGCEAPLLAYLAEESKKYCEEVYYDGYGNVVCHVGGNGPKLLVTAHADEIGFMIKSISKEGFLFFQKIGGTPEKQMEARQVMVNGTIPGVIGCKAGHLQTEQERMTVLPVNELFIDVGVNSREEAEALGIEIGSYASQRFNYMEMANPDLMCCRSLDDRVGCALLLLLMKNLRPEQLKYDLYVAYTLQEETGLRGAQAAANGIEPDLAIAVDTVPCADTPGVNSERDLPLKLGSGFCLSLNEGRIGFANPGMIKRIKAIAKSEGIAYQPALTAGMASTDSYAMSVNGKGTKTATMTVPRRYSHSAVELMDVNDALSLEDMLQAFVVTEYGTV